MADDSERRPLLRPSGTINGDESPTELSGCGASICCDPRRGLHRYFVLIFMCFLSFGSYFCYDNPAALQDSMKRDLRLSSGEYMAFYAWYSWPNVVLCFFGGFLIDRLFGVRFGAILFSLFVTVGQIVFALGGIFNIYWVMVAGRFIFGLGGESLAVAQNTYAVSWFKSKELNMVFGLQLSFSRVGSTVNMNVMQPLYDAVAKIMGIGYETLGFSLLIAGVFCLFSLFCAFVLAYFDRRTARILKRDDAKTGEVIRITDVRYFPFSFWMLSIICVAYYVAVFPFISLGLVFFEMKFGKDPGTADLVNSLPYIISAVASPVFGFFIDKTGRNLFWVLAGVVCTMFCHGLMAFTFFNPFIPMIALGLSYSILASALWPMVSYVIPEHQLGTAYGIMQSVQNLGLAVISIVAGAIVDSHGYLVLEIFFIMWLCLALLATVILYLADAAHGGKLNKSAGERRRQADLEKEIPSKPELKRKDKGRRNGTEKKRKKIRKRGKYCIVHEQGPSSR